MKSAQLHFEPYVMLAGVTPTSVLIAWGGFFFHGDAAGGWRLLHDHQLAASELGRSQSIGAGSEPYGNAAVTVYDRDGRPVGVAMACERNYAWVHGLQPDTEYTYAVRMNGHPFVTDDLRDWVTDDDGDGCLAPARRSYDLRFRTPPDVGTEAAVNMAVIGDYGVGIHRGNAAAARQQGVAAALEAAVERHGLSLVLTTGDNVYLDPSRSFGSGNEDDDWFYAFYQPYRYALARVPFYPCVGNHDTDDTERSDDRVQLIDNFHLQPRFDAGGDCGAVSMEPGLFYTFDYGANVRFLCVDTSRDDSVGLPLAALPRYRQLLERELLRGASTEAWQVVFCHHPPYCAGPRYANNDDLISSLVPMLERRGRCVVLSGHEHNFQYARFNGVHYFVTGAGGKLRTGRPRGFRRAHTRVWSPRGHFLMMRIAPDCVTATPLTRKLGGRPGPIPLSSPDGGKVGAPIVVK